MEVEVCDGRRKRENRRKRSLSNPKGETLLAFKKMFGSRESNPSPAYRMCPSCRGLIDRGARVCPLCGAATGPLRARSKSDTGDTRILGIIPIPGTATATLIAVNIALYGFSWYLTAMAASNEAGSNPGFGTIDGRVLISLGAKYGPAIYAGQWWRLITAMFLHAGVFHIGMNLWCLFDLGPTAESLFNKSKFVVLYLVTGVIGFLFSLWWSPAGISVGASGAILGLVGVLIGASFHHGSMGQNFRSQLWRWVIYIFVFGLFFPVDNAAHLGGLVSGLLLGYFIPEGEPQTRSEEVLWEALGVLAILIMVASFALMALSMNRGLAG